MKTKLFALLSLAGTIIIVVLFNHLTGYQLHTFALWFIIPVGGLIVGAAAASGLFYGHLKENKPVGVREYVIGAIMGLVAFYGINYVSYLTTYVDENKDINYSFKGDPISTYELDGEPITFSKFRELTKESSSQSVYFHGRTTDVDTGKTANSIIDVLQVLASGLAGVLVGFAIAGNKRYCEKCKKYTKGKILFKFDPDRYEEILNSMIAAANNSIVLQKIIAETKLSKEKPDAYIQVEIDYCPDCHDSLLVTRVFKQNAKKEFEELTKFKQSIQISDEASRAIVESLNV